MSSPIPGMCNPRHSAQPFQENVLGFPNNCISSMHLNRSGVEGLVSHHPRSGGDPRQCQSGGILAQRVVCPTQPHAGAASTHGACLSTAQATAQRGSVSVCAAQTGTKHRSLHVWVCFHPLMLWVSRCHCPENDFPASAEQRLLKKQLSLRSSSPLLKAGCLETKAIGLCTFVISTQQ